jgi:hypothetical protein
VATVPEQSLGMSAFTVTLQKLNTSEPLAEPRSSPDVRLAPELVVAVIVTRSEYSGSLALVESRSLMATVR